MVNAVVINQVIVDGVMHAPGQRDEDTRGGFEHGGWATPRNDKVMAQSIGRWMRGDLAFLFGHHGYDHMLEGWNERGPYKDAVNPTPRDPARLAETRPCSAATSHR